MVRLGKVTVGYDRVKWDRQGKIGHGAVEQLRAWYGMRNTGQTEYCIYCIVINVW